MSKFICTNCGCVDRLQDIPTTEMFKGMDEEGVLDGNFPNMSKTEMMGQKSKDTILVSTGETYKYASDVRMLCSECNTGIWHGKFEKVMPTEEETLISLFSSYKAIEPFDHFPNIIAKEEDKYVISNDKFLSFYKLVIEYLTDAGELNENDDSGDFNFRETLVKHPKLYLLFNMLLEDVDKMDMPSLEDIKNLEDRANALTGLVFKLVKNASQDFYSGTWLLSIFMSVVAPTAPLEVVMSTQINCLHVAQNVKIGFFDLFKGDNARKIYNIVLKDEKVKDYLIPNAEEIVKTVDREVRKKPTNRNHWKNTQTPAERDEKIIAAAEKRERKRLKKEQQNGNKK